MVGMRRDRRTREGQGLLKLRRQGSEVYRGLGQWAPLPSAQEMGVAVCGGHLSRQRKDRRRFGVEHLFKAMNSGFSSGQFGQRTP